MTRSIRMVAATVVSSALSVALSLVALLLVEAATARSHGPTAAGFGHVVFFAYFFVWPGVLVLVGLVTGATVLLTGDDWSPRRTKVLFGCLGCFLGGLGLPVFWSSFGGMTAFETGLWAVFGGTVGLIAGIVQWRIAFGPR